MIGVVGDDGTDGLAARFRDADGPVVSGPAERVLDGDPDVVVAIGEAAVVDVVATGMPVPLFVVGAVEGLPSVTRKGALAAADRLHAGEYDTVEVRSMDATVDGSAVGTAVFDVMLVRAEPGRISEYGLAAGGTRARFRADGVVAATPAGSHGYARAAGGPRLSPDADAVAVVPVAPFGLRSSSWVFDGDHEVRLSVERDEGDVSVLVDGRERHRLVGRSTTLLEPGGTFPLVVLPDG